MRKRKVCASRRLNPTIRMAFYEKAKWKCHYCGTKKNENNLSLDHAFPVSIFKKFDRQWNLVVSCRKCNKKKDRSFPEPNTVNFVYKRKKQYELLHATLQKLSALKKRNKRAHKKQLQALKLIHETIQKKYYGKIVFDDFGV